MDTKHDPVFLEILREDKNISKFLDSFFGFLYRCTDFYIECTPEERLGFSPGVAEDLVISTLRNWKNIIAKELEVKTENPLNAKEMSIANVENNGGNRKSNFTKNNFENEEPWKKDPNTSDCYNGASYKSYSWSQSIGDLDVLVRVPWEVRNSKQLRVVLDSQEIEVTKLSVNANQTLIKGRLSFKIKSGESYWSLDPGKHLTLHLEKANERWWESLLEDEPLIQLSKIDCTRKFEEMSECEQMKVEELMWKQRRKSFAQPT